MKFFKGKEDTRVKKIKASRAVYDLHTNSEEVEITFINEDGEKLTLRLNVHQTHSLIMELTTAYDAIRPPLSRGNYAAGWMGMED
jgi:hypothetical protein